MNPMSIRTVEGVLARLVQLADSDPSPDARAAYRVAVNLFARVDSCDMDAVQASFVPPASTGGACTCGLCDVDLNDSPDADWRDQQKVRTE